MTRTEARQSSQEVRRFHLVPPGLIIAIGIGTTLRILERIAVAQSVHVHAMPGIGLFSTSLSYAVSFGSSAVCSQSGLK